MTACQPDLPQTSWDARSILSRALEPLGRDNARALEILAAKIEEGFFELHQTKGALNALADALIEVASGKGAEDAD